MRLSFFGISLLAMFQLQSIGQAGCSRPANCIVSEAVKVNPDPANPENSSPLSTPKATAIRRVITATEIESALRSALGTGSSGFTIEILDFSKIPGPPGKALFPISGATPPPASHPERPFLWRGKILTDSGLEALCWVRLRLLVKRNVIRTKVDLAAGQIVEPEQVERIQTLACPLLTPEDEDLSNYVGLALKRSLRASTLLSKQLVQAPPLVHRGNRVQVEAVSGKTRLSFEAEARANGYLGQSIELSNVHSGRLFWGRVSGTGSVRVEVTRSGLSVD